MSYYRYSKLQKTSPLFHDQRQNRPGPIGRDRSSNNLSLSNNYSNNKHRHNNNNEHNRINNNEHTPGPDPRSGPGDRRINNKEHKREAAPRPLVGGRFDINKLNNNYNFVPQASPGEQNYTKLITDNKGKSKFKFNKNNFLITKGTNIRNNNDNNRFINPSHAPRRIRRGASDIKKEYHSKAYINKKAQWGPDRWSGPHRPVSRSQVPHIRDILNKRVEGLGISSKRK